MRFHLLMLSVALAAIAAPARAADGWSFSTGADYTTGDYGEDQDTDIFIVPFTVTYWSPHWRFGVTAPYVRLEGSGNIIPGTGAGAGSGASGGGGPLGLGGSGGLLNSGLFGSSAPSASPPPPPPPTPARIEEDGLGDVTLSLAAIPYIGGGGDSFTLGLDVRTPTGDETRSLGAGQTIAAMSAEYAFPLGSRAAMYGLVGYQRALDTEDDAMTAGAGVEGFVAERLLLGLSATWAEASLPDQANQTQATLYAGFNATDHVRLVGYALAGLSDSAPDSGGGVRIVLH
ncbi:MAG TPA: hypothetical protein VG841_07085 [Caulobacterales bacterium]|nr:hypothetical protein [Caulobacterales bacterium]